MTIFRKMSKFTFVPDYIIIAFLNVFSSMFQGKIMERCQVYNICISKFERNKADGSKQSFVLFVTKLKTLSHFEIIFEYI